MMTKTPINHERGFAICPCVANARLSLSCAYLIACVIFQLGWAMTKACAQASAASELFTAIPIVFPSPDAQKSNVRITANQPGVGLEDSKTLVIALPIANRGKAVASNVKVSSIKLDSARLIMPTTLPLELGNLAFKGTAVVDATFSTVKLVTNREYVLGVRGTYVSEGKTYGFSVRRAIRLPPSAPGSAQIRTAEVSPQSVRGAPFPHRDVEIPAEVNVPGPPVPTGKLRGNLMPTAAPTTLQIGNAFTPSADPPNDLVFVKNTSFGTPSGLPNDPSGASGGLVFKGPETVLATGNTYGSYSKDGGNTFTQLDPSTIFPNFDGAGNLIDGGLCCDQIIHYSYDIDRFIWLMQFWRGSNGQNRLRIASASPATVVATGGTAWTYWDLTSAVFKLGNQSMDFPDLSVGDHFLYLSVDANGTGLLVARVPLTELRDGVTIHIGYTNPSDGTSAYGNHLVQNSLDEIFWAGPTTNSLMRLFSLKEGSNTYFWRDVPVNTYSRNYYGSTSPDNTDWLANFFYTGPGGTRIVSPGTDEILLAWTAGRGGGFPHSYIQLARIRHSDFQVLDQPQIWNASFGFGFASLTTNAYNAVGISLAFGGGKFFGSPAVGVLGDGVLYPPCFSSANASRYGDFSTVRRAFPNSFLFSAVGYCFSGTFDPHYVLFGRSADVNPPPIP